MADKTKAEPGAGDPELSGRLDALFARGQGTHHAANVAGMYGVEQIFWRLGDGGPQMHGA